MANSTSTPASVLKLLRKQWRAGTSPAEMARSLKERGYTPGALEVAFREAFRIKMRYQRLVGAWHDPGTGVTDEILNLRVTEGIHEAERAGLIPEDPPPPIAAGPAMASRGEALAVLRGQWKAGDSPTAMIRYLAGQGFTPEETGAAIREAFGLGERQQASATRWQARGMELNEELVNKLLSQAIREAEGSGG